MRKTNTIEDYIISEDGNIINAHTGRILKPRYNNKGYGRVQIGGKDYFIHRLVANQYIPNPENKEQVNHIDGDKRNNAVSNLEWVSNKENRYHALENGLHLCGERCKWSKLEQQDVDFIRDNAYRGVDWLANWAGVSRATIQDILSYRTWKYQTKRYAGLV